MTGDADKTALDMVYAAETETELAAAYAAWANGYDTETAALGYCLPFMVAAWVARHVPKGDGPLLDAGCGTGLSGPYLAALGYGDIEGLDLSEEMLELARTRGGYKALTKAALGGPLPWPDGHFSAFISTGVFTSGHAPASSLDELVRITASGGHAIFTVRDTVLDTGGFLAKFAALEASDKWRPVEESPPFRAFAVAEPDVLVKAYTFRVV